MNDTPSLCCYGEYIDLFSLLFWQPETKPWARCDAVAQDFKQCKHTKVELNWNNWLSGYTIYMVVVVQVQPWRASAVIKYFDIIHRAYSSFHGSAWLKYDEMFRMRPAIDLTVPWDRKEMEL